MKFIEVENTIKKWMMLSDKGVVRLMCASILTNYLPTQPAWLFIVGDSSSGKSMLLQTLKKIEGVFELDDMTAQTFASGMKGQSQNSLLFLLPQQGTILMKDYTTMISKDKESRSQILGQMRKIFDGDFRKRFGNGEEVTWQGKLGMLAGVTPEIYNPEFTAANAALGERYLYYQPLLPDRFEVGMWSTDPNKMANHYVSEEEMANVVGEYLTGHIDRTKREQADGNFKLPVVPESARLEIVKLAEMATRARSSVPRNMYSREKEQIMKANLEGVPRFAKSLNCIAFGLLLLHRYDGEPEELSEQDKAILFKIAIDSIPSSRRQILEALTIYSTATSSGLQESMSSSGTYINMNISDLVDVGIATKEKTMHGSWSYYLKHEYRELMAKYKHLDMTTKSLEGETESYLENEAPPTPEETASLQQVGFL